MPWIIDYDLVLDQMRDQQFRCLYHNSGAFGFVDPAGVYTRGWIGPPDDTLKPSARPLTRSVAPPYESALARLLRRVWQDQLPGRVWAMPMSHWAYELDYGSRDWLPALIENIELDPGMLAGRNNAAAIEFAPADADHFEHFVQRLMEMLLGSDFTIAFPDRPVLCTLHHHKQLWWMTKDESLARALDELVAESSGARGGISNPGAG